MDYKDLANLIFPNAKDIKYYEEKYPERNLEEGAMVTRFAPSPTGFIHIGGLFGSIIDRKLAEQSKGVFILRIEDTDQKREIENGVEQIVNGLKDGNYYAAETDEQLKSGSSGGPVFLNGEVVGILCAGNCNDDNTPCNTEWPLNLCVFLSSKVILKLLEKN